MDKTAVVNMTLGHLGEPSIDSLDAPSAAARKVLPFAEAAKDAMLESHGWLVGLAYAAIQPRASLPAGQWKYAACYDLPGDALRLWEVDADDLEAYEEGTITEGSATKRVVWSNNEGPLNCCYVRSVAWEALKPLMCQAVALHLAALSVGPVSGDETGRKGARFLEAAEAMGRRARSAEWTGQREERAELGAYDDPLAALRASAG